MFFDPYDPALSSAHVPEWLSITCILKQARSPLPLDCFLGHVERRGVTQLLEKVPRWKESEM